MLVGCEDGWTAFQTTSTFLDAKSDKQKAKLTQKMANGQKPNILRQIGYFSMYIDQDKGDEFRVQAFRTSIDNYQMIAFDAGEYNKIVDGIYDSGTVAL